MLLTACNADTHEPEEPARPKTYDISIGLGGELNMEVSPLSKAASNDLYGVQVSLRPVGTFGMYKAYAYGLFDDVSQMTVRLLDGYEYEFVATMVVNGKTTIDNSQGYYKAPFTLIWPSQRAKCENRFIEDGGNFFNRLGNGGTQLIEYGQEYPRPFADRYYGKVSEYVPQEGGSVSIIMNRAVFGVKFIAEGLTEGKLLIQMDAAPPLYITADGSQEVEKLVTFAQVDRTTASYAHTEDIVVSVTWEKADGTRLLLANKDLKFTRKQLHTITIKVQDTGIGNSMNLTKEPAEITPGTNTDLGGSNDIDTPVQPAP